MVNKVIIVGASGYIGKQLVSQAKKQYDVIECSSAATEPALRFRLETPEEFDYGIITSGDFVLLPAAISAPDVCARQHEYAWSVNVTGTSAFIEQVTKRGGRVVFFSSDTVYGEVLETFDERAPSKPAGEYAQMKHEVEKRFLGHPQVKSIRLSYVFSKEDKFTRYLLSCKEKGEEAELFHPFCRAIIHRQDVVEGVLGLVNHWNDISASVINFGGPEVVSRVEFAQLLQRLALPGLSYRVTEPAADFF